MGRGVTSYGMVLAASDASHSKIELVQWPEGSHLGERITTQGLDIWDHPAEANVNGKNKKSAWAKIAPSLTTNAECVACFEGAPLLTSAGPCTAKSLSSANVG